MELLEDVIDTPGGVNSQKAVVHSVLALPGNPSSPGAGGISDRAGTFWHKVLSSTRPVISKSKNELQEGDKRWIRWLTSHVRSAAWKQFEENPRRVPAVARKAIRCTAVCLPLLLVATGVIIGVAIALLVLLIRRAL